MVQTKHVIAIVLLAVISFVSIGVRETSAQAFVCPAGYICVPTNSGGGSSGSGGSGSSTTTTAFSDARVTLNRNILELIYDNSRGESALKATYSFSVTAVTKDVYIYKNGAIGGFVNQGGTIVAVGPIVSTLVSDSFVRTLNDSAGRELYVINSGQTVRFTATIQANPKQMFAGTYRGVFQAMYANNSATYGASEFQLELPRNYTNSKTIVGEVSPYITTLTSPIRVGERMNIQGQRLNGGTINLDQVVHIDGQARTVGIVSQAVDGSSMVINLPTLSDGYHIIQIINSTGPNAGASNKFSFQVGNTTNPSERCEITARVTRTYLAGDNSWGFYLIVDSKNKPVGSNGWTANFEGYVPQITSYGVEKLYGNFFSSSGPLQFTAKDQVDSNCSYSITIYPPNSTQSDNLSKREQVRQLYLTLQHREPEQQGWDYWVNNSGSIDSIRQQMMQGIEYQTKQKIAQIFQQQFGRAPIDLEYSKWYYVAEHNNFNIDAIRNQIITNTTPTGQYEPTSTDTARKEQVRQLYLTLMHREPEAQGWDYWVNTGSSIDSIRQQMMQGIEYQTKQKIADIFRQCGKGVPNDLDYMKWYYISETNGFNTDVVKQGLGCTTTTSPGTVTPPTIQRCEITARVAKTYSAGDNSWGFYVVVDSKNKPANSNGWTANFAGYVPQITSYGVEKLYGNFFSSSGPLQFTARDQVDSNCSNTITVYPPSSTPTPIVSTPVLSSISSTSISPGEWLTIYGSGFLSKYTVVSFIGSDFPSHSPNSVSSDGTTLSIIVPHGIPSGAYAVSVVNLKDGSRLNSARSIPLSVRSSTPTPTPVTPAPTASISVSPTIVTTDDSVKVTWSSTNAASCTGIGFSTYNQTSGSQTVRNIGNPGTVNYSVSCTNSAGVSTKSSATLTVTSSTPVPVVSTPVPAPTANFTINGQKSYTYNVGETNNYVWSSTNADKFSSSYTSTGGSVCGGGSWVANTASGSSRSYISSAYAGCTWTVTYTATNSQTGQSASDTVVVKVNPLTTSTSSVWDAIKNIFSR